jgi:hypothetical protein
MGDKRIILFHVWTARKESNEPVAIRFKQDINFAIDDQLSGLMITIWKAADEALFKDEKIHKADLDFEECLKRG